MIVVPIHHHKKFMKECCALINDEWKRSETARMVSLEASCDKLPTNLILISEENQVIGHCKLTPIPSISQSCFIESVVIKKELRGQKLGTYLMREAEKYAKEKLDREMAHLSTKDQEGFYKKLGYKKCSPVTVFGSAIKFVGPFEKNQQLQNLGNKKQSKVFMYKYL